MKTNIIKKLLVTALAVSMVIGSVMTVSATTIIYSSGSDSDDSDSSSDSSPAVEIPTTSSVAGIVTSTPGVYLAQKVNGTAVTTAAATISSGYGLASNEKPYVKFADMDPKKSYAAKAVMDAVVASQGATLGPMVNIELGKMTEGKYSLLSTDGPAIRLAIGIPGNFARDGGTFAMVRVRVGGEVAILPDVDSNPNTITFDTTGGAGAYAIIKY